MSKIRFGIMGAGAIAEHFARAVKLTDTAETVAIASKTIEKAESFALKNNIPAFAAMKVF